MSNRGVVGNECQRTVKDDGALIWLHLHNALSENTSEGFPLSPSQWSDLMGDVDTTIIPEDNVINQYMKERKLDLNAQYSEAEINSSGALCMVGTKDQSIIRTYNEIGSPSFDSPGSTIINPIYDINSQNGKIELTRTDVNKIYRTEYPLTFKYLPPKYTIPKELLRYFQDRRFIDSGSLSPSETRIINEMLQKFIALRAPAKYV